MKRKDTGKPPRARPAGDYADPYQKARRPRPPAPGDAPLRARRPQAAAEEAAPFERRGPRREPGFGSRERGGREGGGREGGGREGGGREGGGREGGGREGSGFSVTLDPDVARVFRGDASVNKALRLVMQLMQVVQGPPRGFGSRPERAGGPPRGGGYRGSTEARGFSRKPRFEANDDEQ